jgi:hypothetical protein
MPLNKTRKMPVCVSFGTFTTDKDDFLIPDFRESDQASFLGLKSGETCPYGSLAYIGKDITATDIITKMSKKARDKAVDVGQLKVLINGFIENLGAFKVGNIVQLTRDRHGHLALVKVADRAPRDPGPRLPG